MRDGRLQEFQVQWSDFENFWYFGKLLGGSREVPATGISTV